MSFSERRIVSLNSKYAQRLNSTYVSNVRFNFSDVLSDEGDIISTQCGIYNAQHPVSFYVIDYRNNVLSYKVNDVVFTVTIAPGNYNSTTFITNLKNGFVANAHLFSVNLGAFDGKITFILLTAATLNEFIESTTTMWNVLGFNTGVAASASSNTIVCPNPLNLLGIKKLKVYSDSLAIQSIDSKNLSTSSLVDTIPVISPPYELNQYFNPQAPYSKISVNLINQIDIKILDEDGNFINFNGVDWTITLVLIILREQNGNGKGNLQTVLEKIDTTLHDIESVINPGQVEETPLPPPQQQTDVGDLDILEFQNP